MLNFSEAEQAYQAIKQSGINLDANKVYWDTLRGKNSYETNNQYSKNIFDLEKHPDLKDKEIISSCNMKEAINYILNKNIVLKATNQILDDFLDRNNGIATICVKKTTISTYYLSNFSLIYDKDDLIFTIKKFDNPDTMYVETIVHNNKKSINKNTITINQSELRQLFMYMSYKDSTIDEKASEIDKSWIVLDKDFKRINDEVYESEYYAERKIYQRIYNLDINNKNVIKCRREVRKYSKEKREESELLYITTKAFFNSDKNSNKKELYRRVN